MNIFDGSMEQKCSGCGEALLLFNGDEVHSDMNGFFCAECAKEVKCTPISMGIITFGDQEEMTCHDCGVTISAIQDAYIYDQEKPPAVVCKDCDSKRTPP